MLKNARLGAKLLTAFAAMAAIMAVVNIISYRGMTATGERQDAMYKDRLLPAIHAGSAAEQSMMVRGDIYKYVLLPAEREDADRSMASAITKVDKQIEAYRASALTPDEEKALTSFDAAWTEYQRELDGIKAKAAAGDTKGAIAPMMRSGRAATLRKQINAALGKLNEINAREAKLLDVQTDAALGQIKTTIVISTIVAIMLALSAGWLLTRSITGPVARLMEMLKQMSMGDLSTRLKPTGGDEIADMSRTADEFADVLQGTYAAGLQQIAAGDLTLEVKSRCDKDEISPALAAIVTSLRAMVRDAEMLAKAAVEGRLGTRADASVHQGDFRKIVQSVNSALDAVVSHVDSVPAPAMIVDRDFNIQYMNRAALEVIGQTSDRAVGAKCYDHFRTDHCRTSNCAIARCMRDGSVVAESTTARPQGRELLIDYAATPIRDGSGTIVGALEVVTDQTAVRRAAATAANVARYQSVEVERLASNLRALAVGDLHMDLSVDDGDADTAATRDDFARIVASLGLARDAVAALVADADMLSRAAVEGKLATRADASKHQGDFRKIVQGVNDTLDAVIGPLNVAAGYVDRISKGDIPPRIADAYNGDFNTIKSNLNTCIDAVNQLVQDANTLVAAAVAGELATRADASKHQGDFRKIVQGVNDTLDAVINPVNEAAEILDRVADRDMTARVTGDYKGDHAKIKNSLNQAVDNLDDGLKQVAIGADQVAGAAVEISSGSQTLSQGSTEQASSLEEISSSLEEMSSMTKQNSGNAREAASMSDAARSTTAKGMDSMERLSDAMNRIKASADETAKIVKTIDEIAFQTNLLALNAAVEAARAGDAGKGFAVVAEEVRNLAMRSAEAAKTTANLIEGAVKNAEGGVAINGEVIQNLREINDQVNKVSEVMAEIAESSEQQSLGIDQVTSAVGQMDQITQQNAANAEESASAAEELSSQAEEMQTMVAGFKLSGASTAVRTTAKRSSSAAGAMPKPRNGNGNGKSARMIPLDDREDMHVLQSF